MNYLLDALLHGDELEVRAQRRQLIVARRLLELSVALGSVEFHPFGGQSSGFGHCHGHFLDAHLVVCVCACILERKRRGEGRSYCKSNKLMCLRIEIKLGRFNHHHNSRDVFV